MKTNRTQFVLGVTLISASLMFVAGCNRTPEVGTEPVPKTTVGIEIDDSVVTARVKSALLSEAAIKSFDIKVETRKGEVQLSGFVDNDTQVNRAMEIAHNVDGVKNVVNKMSIKQ